MSFLLSRLREAEEEEEDEEDEADEDVDPLSDEEEDEEEEEDSSRRRFAILMSSGGLAVRKDLVLKTRERELCLARVSFCPFQPNNATVWSCVSSPRDE